MNILHESPRTFLIDAYQKTLKTPFFVPAISTVKTNFSPLEYIEIIKKIGFQGYLVSAYDIYHSEENIKKEILKKISESTEQGAFTFLDSGNYESYWYNDDKWDMNQLESILSEVTIDFCFSYDLFWTGKLDEYIKDSITQIAKTAGMQKSGTTVPIVHSNPELFPKVIRKIVDGINPEIIAVPERELGSEIFERARTVKRIREELDKTNPSIPLHLLGTGNPISILIYSVCGADMYDGLEWCKNVVNPETGHLYHFVQMDLIECNCDVCKNKNLSYPFRVMAHNLNFYERFLTKIRESFKENNFGEILEEFLGKNKSSNVKRIAGLK